MNRLNKCIMLKKSYRYKMIGFFVFYTNICLKKYSFFGILLL